MRDRPGIAPGWSACCDAVLSPLMSDLSNIAADGSRRSDISSWPIADLTDAQLT